MEFNAFLTTLSLVFVAELGDKTQFAVMALSARHPWRKVLAGAFAAFFVLNALAVSVGGALSHWLKPEYVKVGAGIIFLIFGGMTLFAKDDEDEGEEENQRRANSVVWTAFTMIFLAELGDKTQLATATLSAQFAAPVYVFAGSTIALWSVSALGALMGIKFLSRLSKKAIHLISGTFFVVFGLYALYSAWAG